MCFIRLCMACIAMLLASCGALPTTTPRSPSTSLEHPDRTSLGRLVRAVRPAAAGAGISGFALLADGREALDARLALVDSATRTLDLQYYLIAEGATVDELERHIVAAAERGVRVRILVDDFNTAGQDARGSKLISHPRIEVRLFNPFARGRESLAARLLMLLGDDGHLSRRMHNKLMVTDNAVAVTGGRNLGDSYFVRSTDSNFVDLDVFVAGDAVQDMSRAFDRYWNDDLAYPVQAFVRSPATVPEAGGAPADVAPTPWVQRRVSALEWTPASVLVDDPSKIANGRPRDGPSTFDDEIVRLVEGATHEVVIVSPYFVPGRRGIELAARLHRRGVRMVVLTNSLAATDAPAVHAGYAPYREQLVAEGVELYELRPEFARNSDATRRRFGDFATSRASLHAKLVVVDRATAVIGSMNVDPRSRYSNTEMAIVVHSPALAAEALHLFEDPSHENAYRVRLAADGSLEWVLGPKGRERVSRSEPEVSLWRRLGLILLTPFTPEDML